jgi:hypothetical protein
MRRRRLHPQLENRGHPEAAMLRTAIANDTKMGPLVSPAIVCLNFAGIIDTGESA